MSGSGAQELTGWRQRLYVIIFESDTPAGKLFDLALLASIVASVVAVCLESVVAIEHRYGSALRVTEWVFTVLFTVEYLLRLICTRRPLRYATSFFGVVDLLAVLPTYISVLVPGAQSLLVIRALRLLRIFRVLKLGRYIGESRVLMVALRNSRIKITVFLFGVLTITLIMGAVMYLVEGAAHGFTSIPRAMYWAIVTLTTVGFGDVAPQTATGQALASVLMVMGYGIIAVPTGIVTAELTSVARQQSDRPRSCPECLAEDLLPDARFCRHCGSGLP